VSTCCSVTWGGGFEMQRARAGARPGGGVYQGGGSGAGERVRPSSPAAAGGARGACSCARLAEVPQQRPNHGGAARRCQWHGRPRRAQREAALALAPPPPVALAPPPPNSPRTPPPTFPSCFQNLALPSQSTVHTSPPSDCASPPNAETCRRGNRMAARARARVQLRGARLE
jgi:hypothetical protein